MSNGASHHIIHWTNQMTNEPWTRLLFIRIAAIPRRRLIWNGNSSGKIEISHYYHRFPLISFEPQAKTRFSWARQLMTIMIRTSLLWLDAFSIKSNFGADRMFIIPLFCHFPLIYRKLHFEFRFRSFHPSRLMINLFHSQRRLILILLL